MKEELELVEFTFDETDEFGTGIMAVSVVKDPAIKKNFMVFSEQKSMKFEAADKEKRLLVGPALIPDMPIFRKDGEREFYGYFPAETIEKMAYAFLRHSRQNNSTIEHAVASDRAIGIVESWIVADPEKDKSASLGMEVPAGTWMIAMKVQDETMWEEWVKTGKVRGFSIEAMLSEAKKEMSVQERIENAVHEMYDQFKSNEQTA